VKAAARWSWQQSLILLITLACVALTASLGAWQMRRATYKQQLAEQISNQNKLEPVVNSTLLAADFVANSESYLQRRASLRGRWLHAQSVFLDNRPMLVAGSQRVGFYVATPLALEGSEGVIWVQRGWVQRDFQDRSKLPKLAESTELVNVQGRLVAQVSRAYEMQASASTPTGPSRIWQNLPNISFSSKTLLPMALLQTAPEADQDDLLRDWPAADTGVAKHHGYAFQWFALSALLVVLYVWFQFIAPRRRQAAL
jgi:surfeit locus 1 family protein